MGGLFRLKMGSGKREMRVITGNERGTDTWRLWIKAFVYLFVVVICVAKEGTAGRSVLRATFCDVAILSILG